MSDTLIFFEHTVHLWALIFMVVVYCLRLWWLMRFKASKERQPKTGSANTSRKKGIVYSWANIAMPWAMESTRKGWLLYLQFVVFHVAVAVNILLCVVVIPYLPSLLVDVPGLVQAIQISLAGGFVVGLLRIARRVGSKYMRAISTPDDYFSVLLLTAWMAMGYLAAPNDYINQEGIVLGYIILSSFFLIYVPFSKISHYLYYPFTRYYFGKTMGHRGTYPMVRSKPGHAGRLEPTASMPLRELEASHGNE